MRLSLATRIFLGYAAVLLTFGAVSIFAVTEMHRDRLEIRLVSEGYLHLSQDIAAIETFQHNQEKDTARISDEESPHTRRALIRLARVYYPPLMSQKLSLARARAAEVSTFAPPSEAEFLLEIGHKLTELESRFRLDAQAAEQVYAALEPASPDLQRVSDRVAQWRGLEAALSRDIRLLHLSLESRLRDRVHLAEQREKRAGLAIIGLSILAIVVGLLATLVSAKSLKPVRTLIEGVSKIAKGDYSAELGLSGEDEIATLAKEFDQMARALRERALQLAEKQEALLKAQKLAAVGQISASIAHEVRNPLSSIGLNVELLQEALSQAQFPSSLEQRETQSLLSSVLREVDRLAEITEQYLHLARPHRPNLQVEDLHQVLDSVLEFAQAELEQAKITVERRFEVSAAKAMADEAQLRQVFLNLIKNSKEAMASGGALTIGSRVRDGLLELSVSDTGQGIREDVRQRIFEPFFSTKARGTGLGLAVSQQILQAHGGSIECLSVPGGGTTFVVKLPSI